MSKSTTTQTRPDREHLADAARGSGRRDSRWLRDVATAHWVLLAVVGTFVLTALLLPVTAAVAINDDWIYTRSVEILLDEGRLRVLDITPATAFFQIFWGAPFAALSDNTFGALRVATVSFILLSSFAVYGLCLELRLSRNVAALGTALYLFNPLNYALAFSFMSDPYFTGLLVIASYLYVRGIAHDDGRIVLAASSVAALALLQRALGVLIPAAVVAYLLVGRRLRFSRSSLRLLAQVVAVPVAATVALMLWLLFVNGVTDVQGGQLASIRGAGFGRALSLLTRISYVEALYLGVFALPLLPAAVVGVVRSTSRFRRVDWGVLLTLEAILVTGLAVTLGNGQPMPHAPHFLNVYGLGPRDVVGRSISVAPAPLLLVLTISCAVTFAALFMLLYRRARSPSERTGSPALPLVLSLAAFQVVASLVPSLHWALTGIGALSLDRYFVPLLPLAVCLALVGLQRGRLLPAVTWIATVLMAIFSVVGTRDSIVFHQVAWDLARSANAAGVPNTSLDGGYSWSAYHLYELSQEQDRETLTPNAVWWIPFAAAATDSTYLVSREPFPGHEVVERRAYSPVLGSQPSALYLLRRIDRSGVKSP